MLFVVIYKDVAACPVHVPISTVRNTALGSSSCLSGQLPTCLALHLPWPEILISTQPATVAALNIIHSGTDMTATALSYKQNKTNANPNPQTNYPAPKRKKYTNHNKKQTSQQTHPSKTHQTQTSQTITVVTKITSCSHCQFCSCCCQPLPGILKQKVVWCHST